MATIKAIEGRSVHQIQSGQVIVDLCSVVKELVENSLDAGATSIDVRFKKDGVDSIEVQDNGEGIAPDNYETVALKHYTSKLSTYDDLSSLDTFGFRGEALSSLCALSKFHITTARANEAPKGTRLDFEISGKLKSTQVVASQKGTTVTVENLFQNLPVRRRELEKNVKREYQKVLLLLHAYACVSVRVRFRVINQASKGRSTTAFSTNGNPTTRENIANVFGAKTLPALIALDLKFELQLTVGQGQKWSSNAGKGESGEVRILGHVSRPVFGEGRQTPDRQMLFVNGRPCVLPQISKVFNEVYKSYNITQSPFIFANLLMDTNAYDVNVSPDKRTILLHDQNALLEGLKSSLTELFDNADQTVPQSEVTMQKLPMFRQLTINREISIETRPKEHVPEENEGDNRDLSSNGPPAPLVSMNSDSAATSLIQNFLDRKTDTRSEKTPPAPAPKDDSLSKGKEKLLRKFAQKHDEDHGIAECDDVIETVEKNEVAQGPSKEAIQVQDFNDRVASQQQRRGQEINIIEHSEEEIDEGEEEPIPSVTKTPAHSEEGPLQKAFARVRPKRTAADDVTITIGDKTVTSTLGSLSSKRQKVQDHSPPTQRKPKNDASSQIFSQSLRAFTAPGTQKIDESMESDEVSSVGKSIAESENSDEDEDEDEEDEGRNNIVASGSLADANDPEPTQHTDNESENESENVNDTCTSAHDNDTDYIDEDEKRRKEEIQVQEMIREAEQSALAPTENDIKRTNNLFKRQHIYSTIQLIQSLDTNLSNIDILVNVLDETSQRSINNDSTADIQLSQGHSPEDQLSLTILKDDFKRMQILGQFNLGFIIALRPHLQQNTDDPDTRSKDELFIIDQHASDEKYNFERLQAETVVQNQRLVKPHTLDLTALEEEIIIENTTALGKNGFLVHIDDTGSSSIGRRCKLISIPMSREVVFDTRDLEELIAMLADSPSSASGSYVPRPGKVRRMFAMRACRSSIMIGKTLTSKQMEKVVRHLGGLDKPWNCPHGRPTMRHLCTLDAWDSWKEGDGVVGLMEEEAAEGEGQDMKSLWSRYVNDVPWESSTSDDEEDEDEEENDDDDDDNKIENEENEDETN